MSKTDVYHYKDVDFNNFYIYEPQFNEEYNCFVSQVRYKNKEDKQKKFLLQTPKLKIKSEMICDEKNDRFSFLCNFPLKHPEFYSFMYKLEKYIINTITRNSVKWLDTKFNLHTVEDLYDSCIRPSEDMNINKIKLNMEVVDGSIQCKIFDKYESLITADKLVEDRDVVVVLEFKEIIYHEHKFYSNWKVYQMKLPNYPYGTKKYKFIDDEDINEDIDETEYIHEVFASESDNDESVIILSATKPKNYNECNKLNIK